MKPAIQAMIIEAINSAPDDRHGLDFLSLLQLGVDLEDMRDAITRCKWMPFERVPGIDATHLSAELDDVTADYLPLQEAALIRDVCTMNLRYQELETEKFLKKAPLFFGQLSSSEQDDRIQLYRWMVEISYQCNRVLSTEAIQIRWVKRLEELHTLCLNEQAVFTEAEIVKFGRLGLDLASLSKKIIAFSLAIFARSLLGMLESQAVHHILMGITLQNLEQQNINLSDSEALALTPYATWQQDFTHRINATFDNTQVKTHELEQFSQNMARWRERFRDMADHLRDKTLMIRDKDFVAEKFGLQMNPALTPQLLNADIENIQKSVAHQLLDIIDSSETVLAIKPALQKIYAQYYSDIKKPNSLFSSKLLLINSLEDCMDAIRTELGVVRPAWLESLTTSLDTYKTATIESTDNTDAKTHLADAFTNAYENTRSSTCRRLLTNLGLILITAGLALPVIVIKGLLGKNWGFFYDTTLSAQIKLSKDALLHIEPIAAPG